MPREPKKAVKEEPSAPVEPPSKRVKSNHGAASAQTATLKKENSSDSDSDSDSDQEESKHQSASKATNSRDTAAAQPAFFIDTMGAAASAAKPSTSAVKTENNKKRKREDEPAVKTEPAPPASAEDSDSDSDDSDSGSGSDLSSDSEDDDEPATVQQADNSDSDSASGSDSDSDSDDDDAARAPDGAESDGGGSDLTSDEEGGTDPMDIDSGKKATKEESKDGNDKDEKLSKPLTPNQILLAKLLTELAALTPAQRKAIPKNHPLSKRNIKKLGKEDRAIKTAEREERLKRKRAKRRAKTAWMKACEEATERGLPHPPREDFKPKPIKIKIPLASSKDKVAALVAEKAKGKSDVILVQAKKKVKKDPREAIVAKIKENERELQLLRKQILGTPLPEELPPKPEPKRDEFGNLLPGEKAIKKKPEDRNAANISSKRLENKQKEQKAEKKRLLKTQRRQERASKLAADIAAGIVPPPPPPDTPPGGWKKGTRKKEQKRKQAEEKKKNAEEHAVKVAARTAELVAAGKTPQEIAHAIKHELPAHRAARRELKKEAKEIADGVRKKELAIAGKQKRDEKIGRNMDGPPQKNKEKYQRKGPKPKPKHGSSKKK